jgi:hypothetical protein
MISHNHRQPNPRQTRSRPVVSVTNGRNDDKPVIRPRLTTAAPIDKFKPHRNDTQHDRRRLTLALQIGQSVW